MLKDIEKKAGTTPPPEPPKFTAGDKEMFEQLARAIAIAYVNFVAQGGKQGTRDPGRMRPINLF